MRTIFLMAVLCCFGVSQAQFGKNCETQQIKINLFSPGLEYEWGYGVNQTLDFRIAWQLALDPAFSEPLQEITLFPAITVQQRNYFNFDRRYRNGRQAYGNSANYIAPTVALLSPDARVNDQNERIDGVHGYAGLVLGLQRSYNSGLSFSIDAGAAYYAGPFRGGIHPVMHISLGWIVSARRWCVGK